MSYEEKKSFNNLTSIPTTDQQQLDEIRDKIQSKQEAYAQSFYEIGMLLLQAKHLLTKHGQWQQWIKNNTDFSLSKAERLMKAARFLQESAPELNLNFSQTYVLTALPSKEINSFLAQAHLVPSKSKCMRINEMSKRDLEIVVRNYIKNRNLRSNTGQISKKSHPPTASPDSNTVQFNKIRSSINDLANLVEKNPELSTPNGLLVEELYNLCTEVIRKLPQAKLEDL